MAQATTATASASAKRVKYASKPLPLEYLRKPWLQAIVIFGFFFLYFPIIALMATSFNEDKRNFTEFAQNVFQK